MEMNPRRFGERSDVLQSHAPTASVRAPAIHPTAVRNVSTPCVQQDVCPIACRRQPPGLSVSTEIEVEPRHVECGWPRRRRDIILLDTWTWNNCAPRWDGSPGARKPRPVGAWTLQNVRALAETGVDSFPRRAHHSARGGHRLDFVSP